MNNGEIDELKAKLSLIYWRDNNQNGIKSVGVYDKAKFIEYKSHGLSLQEINQLTQVDLVYYCNISNIKKAPSSIKADICINGDGISLKSNRSALPALINHTHRVGIEKVCERINMDITPLDRAIDEYWQKRQDGLIREDVKMCSPGNPFRPIKESLVQLLAYFLFIGTAKGDSPVQAKGLISFTNPIDYQTWSFYSREDAARQYIDYVTISIRSKAMPSTYIHQGSSDRDQSISRWTRWFDSAHKGTLHIRG